MEEWKEIVDHWPGFAVSSKGNIKNLKTGHIRKLRKTPGGYWRLGLGSYGRNRKYYAVHALVAHYFIGPRPEGLVIDHINEIRGDNRVDNLRYVTLAQNTVRAKFPGKATGVRGVYINYKKFSAHIKKDRKRYYLGAFETVKGAAEAYNIASRELFGSFGFQNDLSVL